MQVNEHWVHHTRGRLFARTWTPTEEQAGTSAPVVLLHDSLGCVECGGTFPPRWPRPPDAASSPTTASAPQLTCPALVLHGEADEYGSARHPQRLCAGLGADARALLLPGVGHVPHREQAATVLAAVGGWLAAQSSVSTEGSPGSTRRSRA